MNINPQILLITLFQSKIPKVFWLQVRGVCVVCGKIFLPWASCVWRAVIPCCVYFTVGLWYTL